jgi:threonine synthase
MTESSRYPTGRLVCTSSGDTYPDTEPRWRSDTGELLDIDWEPRFDLDLIRRHKGTLWRYREGIPLREDANIVSLDEGFTPLTDVTLDGRNVLFKQDHLFPSGSYKDCGATVLVSKARELAIERVVQDSSGNAGCSVAAYCTRARIACEIFVPARTSPAKLAQIQSYGAKLRLIDGSRADTTRAALAAAETTYYASHCWNPYFLHGTKTFAFEVCEQLGWELPDTVILPVGNGTLLLGAYLGFKDLIRAGVTQGFPRLVGVQAAACAPLYYAFLSRSPSTLPKAGETMAEGIAIEHPVRGEQILAAIRETKGTILSVSEEEIADSLRLITAMGFYVEPTAAATVAGVRSYLASATGRERVVSVFTGHGLKSTEKMLHMFHPTAGGR